MPRFFACKFKVSRATATRTIPIIAKREGSSSGSINQLKTAPRTGIINFHIFSVEILTPVRLSNVYQMDMAAAERKLNQPKATKNSIGKGPRLGPSTMIPIINSMPPPIIIEKELRINGGIRRLSLATKIFPKPERTLLPIRIKIPNPTRGPTTPTCFVLSLLQQFP